jgi:hypothetical protein
MKTSELTGAALDWAVAKITNPEWTDEDRWYNTIGYVDTGDIDDEPYAPSANWSQAGPIIEREEIGIQCVPAGTCKGWWALVTSCFHDRSSPDEVRGDTPLVAAMRCYVASKLGDTIDIPEELK